MRQEPAGFHRKAKPCRRGLAPLAKAFGGGQMVEAVVDLHRIEVAQITAEHLAGGQVFWIEKAAPVLVMPS
jgi:hypothetical protein